MRHAALSTETRGEGLRKGAANDECFGVGQTWAQPLVLLRMHPRFVLPLCCPEAAGTAPLLAETERNSESACMCV